MFKRRIVVFLRGLIVGICLLAAGIYATINVSWLGRCIGGPKGSFFALAIWCLVLLAMFTWLRIKILGRGKQEIY